MDVAITGTPGTGKSSLARVLRERGYTVLSVRELALETGTAIQGEGDELEVDINSLAAMMFGRTAGLGDPVFIEGHLSHLLPVDMAVVLRSPPSLIGERLKARGYSEEKVRENMEAEAVGVCLVEAVEAGLTVCEIDSSKYGLEELAAVVVELVEWARGGEPLAPYEPGGVDWMEEVMGWY
ncbi:MAG: adenylate kinase family protein [Thermoplasmata archaeon]|nr:adenylate kinase family protein [Thermoplasmata archaeon]